MEHSRESPGVLILVRAKFQVGDLSDPDIGAAGRLFGVHYSRGGFSGNKLPAHSDCGR